MPELEYLMTYRADLEEPVDIGTVPSGTRQIFDVKRGSFEGDRTSSRAYFNIPLRRLASIAEKPRSRLRPLLSVFGCE